MSIYAIGKGAVALVAFTGTTILLHYLLIKSP